jgi:hypothetical protein
MSNVKFESGPDYERWGQLDNSVDYIFVLTSASEYYPVVSRQGLYTKKMWLKLV